LGRLGQNDSHGSRGNDFKDIFHFQVLVIKLILLNASLAMPMPIAKKKLSIFITY
jgi:hypothetical protein